MKAILFGSGRTVELLTKGVTTRHGHWHRYGSRLKWVNTHPLSYHEGMGQPSTASQKREEANPHQGSLFEIAHHFQQQHAKKTRLVVPRKQGANLQQMDLFAAREVEQPEEEQTESTVDMEQVSLFQPQSATGEIHRLVVPRTRKAA